MTRKQYLHSRIMSLVMARPLHESKVILVLWPGRPDEQDSFDLAKMEIHLFATHLEAGLFMDMFDRKGWSMVVYCRPTAFNTGHP